MKKLMLTLLLLLPMIVFGQLKTTKDSFDGTIARKTDLETVCRSFKEGTAKLSITQYIADKDTTMILFIYLEPTSMSCFGSDSKVMLKSGDDIISIKLEGDIDCKSAGDILMNYGQLSKEDITFLKQHNIEIMRLYFTEGYANYTINKPNYFIKTLNYF